MELRESLYEFSQTRFIAVGVFLMQQTESSSFIKKYGNFFVLFCCFVFVRFIAKTTDGITNRCTIAAIAETLFLRSFHPFLTRFVLWQSKPFQVGLLKYFSPLKYMEIQICQ